MTLGVAQLAVVVDAASEQVVEQALLHLLQLGDDGFGLADGLVEGVEDLGDLALLGEGRKLERADASRELPGFGVALSTPCRRSLSECADRKTSQ